MGDRVSAVIDIGGELPRSLLPELLAACQEEGVSLDWGCGAELSAEEIEGETQPNDTDKEGLWLHLTAHEVNYAEFTALEAFCTAHGLHYRKAWDQGGDFGPGACVWRGADPLEEYTSTGTDGDVLLHGNHIKRLGSFEAVLAHIDALEAPIPPLKITEG